MCLTIATGSVPCRDRGLLECKEPPSTGSPEQQHHGLFVWCSPGLGRGTGSSPVASRRPQPELELGLELHPGETCKLLARGHRGMSPVPAAAAVVPVAGR